MTITWLVEHIFYGMATLQYGGLTLQALSGGMLGEHVSLQVNQGAVGNPLTVVVTSSELDHAILVTAPPAATEGQVLQALQASADAAAVVDVEQTTGDGTAVVAPIAKTNLVAQSGLLQALRAEFNLDRWDDRDLKTTGQMQALLWPSVINSVRMGPVGVWHFEGLAQAGIAITNKFDFATQNAILMQLGRRTTGVLRKFKAPNLDGIAPTRTAFTNMMRDESAGQPKKLETALCRVLVSFDFRFNQPANLNPPADPLLTQIQCGLFIQPDDTSPGDPGFDLDSQIVVNQQS